MSDGSDKTPSVKVFISSLSLNKEVKMQQQRIIQTFDAKKIAYEKKDIAVDQEAKRELRRLMRAYNPNNVTTPQIFSGDLMCGDYEAFYWAVEENNLQEFLRLTPPAKQKSQAAVAVTPTVQPAQSTPDNTTLSTAADSTEQSHSEESSERLTTENLPPPSPPELNISLVNNPPTSTNILEN